nr:zinc finger, CCHC-type, retrotransposon Gag domain protein [Tanacetum cinerariifolium]
FFPRAEQERLKREYHSIRQTNTETSMEFMQRFLRLARLAVYKFEGNALAWWKAYKQAKGGDAWLITTNTETSTEFMQRFLRLAGFLRAAAGTEEE